MQQQKTPYRDGFKGIELVLDLMTQEDIDYRTIGTAYGSHWEDIVLEMIEMENLLHSRAWIRAKCRECDAFQMQSPEDRARGFRWGVDESKVDVLTGEPVKVCLGHRRGYDWMGRPSRPGIGIECLRGCSVNGEIGPARVCLLAGMRRRI